MLSPTAPCYAPVFRIAGSKIRARHTDTEMENTDVWPERTMVTQCKAGGLQMGNVHRLQIATELKADLNTMARLSLRDNTETYWCLFWDINNVADRNEKKKKPKRKNGRIGCPAALKVNYSLLYCFEATYKDRREADLIICPMHWHTSVYARVSEAACKFTRNKLKALLCAHSGKNTVSSWLKLLNLLISAAPTSLWWGLW